MKNFGVNFTAITGNNGCGKSNILDSICFVLGISYLNIIRASKIEDLINSDENIKLNSARVALTLKKLEINKSNEKILKNEILIVYHGKYFLLEKIDIF